MFVLRTNFETVENMSRRSSLFKKKIKDEPVDNEEIFEVQAILDKRVVLGKVCQQKNRQFHFFLGPLY